MSSKKVLTVVVTSAALLVGSAAISNADTKSKRTTVTKTVTRTTTIANPNGAIRGPQATLATVLKDLVSKGTITQTQADAITAAVNAAEAAEHADRPMGMGKGGVPADFAAREALIASTLGIDTATIKSRLAAGESLAAIAGAKKDALIAALVADETKRIDAAVTAGKITADKAATLKANLTAHITEEINKVGGFKPGMGPKGEKRGHKGGMGGGMSGGPMGSAPQIPTPAASAAASTPAA